MKIMLDFLKSDVFKFDILFYIDIFSVHSVNLGVEKIFNAI